MAPPIAPRPPLPRPAAHARGAGRADSRTQNGGRDGCGHSQWNQQRRRQEALRSEESETLPARSCGCFRRDEGAGAGLMPASGTEKGATSRSPHELGARFRTGAVGRARRGLWGILACVLANGWVGPSHVQRELANQRARLAEPGAGAGAPAGPCRSGDAPVGTCPGRDVPRSGLRRSLPSDAAAPTGLGYSVPRASGQLGPASSAGVLPPPHHPRPLWPNRLGCPMCCAKCFLRMSVADFFSPSYLNRAITTC